MRNEDLLHETYEQDPYAAVRDYRHELDQIAEKAERHFTGCIVEPRHSLIYAQELKSIQVPNVPGYEATEDLEKALQRVRVLVNKR